jgi:gamma-glutamyltranspeptidase/glutathione hydrolase
MSRVDPIRVAVFLLVCAVMAPSCTTVTDAPEVLASGPVISRLDTDAPQSTYGMVATANPQSSRIAVEILESGGNAIDAAVAAAFALGVSDPGDSGLGGITYILIRFADGRAIAIDGSAITPLKVDRSRLESVQATGVEHGMELAAVPTTLAVLDLAASRYGTLSLADLIEPSIELARRGYYPVPFQEVAIRKYLDEILQTASLKHFVLIEGETPPSTSTLQCRPVLANTLRRIAIGGSNEFYRGSIAAEIETDMIRRGGFIRRHDLAMLRIGEVTPLRGTYRGTEVLALPHPSMGGAVIQALNILEQYSPEFFDQNTVERHQVVAETFHIATADHMRLLQDGSFAASRARDRLLSEGFAAERAALIQPGQPLISEEFPPVHQGRNGDGNTTQVSIVDRWGNAVSLTQTLGRFFGNKRLTPGLAFPYNSLLEGETASTPRARIPSFMCPSIVVKDGEILLALGSASSTQIPGVVATIISNVVDRKLDLRDAVIAPRILWGTVDIPGLYAEIFPPITGEQIIELGAFGYEPIFRAQIPVRQSRFVRFGAVNAVHFDRESQVMSGVGDPRRNGNALGARF